MSRSTIYSLQRLWYAPNSRGDQLNRYFGHFRIEKGRQNLVRTTIKGPTG